MVEHADLIDTVLLHEPKGIKESTAGAVYVSTVEDPTQGPWSGEWRQLEFGDLAFTAQYSAEQTYTPQPDPTTISSTITAVTTGTLTDASTFLEVNSNTQDLYLALVNARSRLTTLEDTVSKLKTLTTALDEGLKSLGLFTEEQ